MNKEQYVLLCKSPHDENSYVADFETQHFEEGSLEEAMRFPSKEEAERWRDTKEICPICYKSHNMPEAITLTDALMEMVG